MTFKCSTTASPRARGRRFPDDAERPIVHVTETVVQTVAAPQSTRVVEVPYPVAVAVPVYVRPAPQAAPVYWGFGGQRRPDSWAPTPDPYAKQSSPSKTSGQGGKADVKPGSAVKPDSLASGQSAKP